MNDHACWQGIEAEGRYRGIRTIFIREYPEIDADFEEFISAWPHIYFHKDFTHRHGFDLPAKMAEEKLVTVEVPDHRIDKVPFELMENARIIGIIEPDPLLLVLKSTDEIRLDFGDLRNMIASVELFHLTSEEDYKDDEGVA